MDCNVIELLFDKQKMYEDFKTDLNGRLSFFIYTISPLCIQVDIYIIRYRLLLNINLNLAMKMSHLGYK